MLKRFFLDHYLIVEKTNQMNKNIFILFLFLSSCFYSQTSPVTRAYLEQTLAHHGIERNMNLLSILYSLEDDELVIISEEALEKIIIFLRPLSAFFSLEKPFIEQTRFKLFEFLNYLMPKRLIFLIVSGLPLAECGPCGQLIKEIFESVAHRLFPDTNYFQIRSDDGNGDRFNFQGANELFDGSIRDRLKAILGLCGSCEAIKEFVREQVQAMTTKRASGLEFGHSSDGKLWFFRKFECLLNE